MIFLKSIEIEGYRSYGDKQVIDLSSPGIILITGQNEDRGISQAAGKSSIFKAIQTALFEENDDGSIKDHGINVIRNKGCYIGLNFDVDRKSYYIIYSRKHKEFKDEWGLWRWDENEWTDLRGEKFGDTKKIIGDIINISSRDFVSIAYIQQSEIAKFISCLPGEREEVFSNVLGINSLESLRKREKDCRWKLNNTIKNDGEKVELLKKSIDNVQYELNNIQYTPATQNIFSLSLERIKSYCLISTCNSKNHIVQSRNKYINQNYCSISTCKHKNNIDECVFKYINQNDRINTQYPPDYAVRHLNNCAVSCLSELQNNKNQLGILIGEKQNKLDQAGPYLRLDERVRLLKSEIEALNIAHTKAYSEWDSSAEDKYEKAQSNLTYISQLYAISSRRVGELNMRLKRLNGNTSSICEECNQPLTQAHKKDLTSRLNNELKVYQESLDGSYSEIEKYKKIVAEAQSTMVASSVAITEVGRILSRHTQLSIELRELENKQKDLQSIFGSAPELVMKEIPVMQAALDEDRIKEKEVIGDISRLESIINSLISIDQRLTQTRSDIEKYENNINEAEEEIGRLKICDDIISTFKTYRIDTSREMFNTSLARYLGIIADGEVEAEMVTEVAKADKKGTKSEIDIIVKEGDKQGVSIKHYSGGEKTSLSLAITGAFWDLANFHSNNSVNVLLLDEPFGMVDKYSEEKACQFLQYLKSLGRTVFVITNRNSVRDTGVFDREIRAVKKNHITTLQFFDLSSEH